MRNRLYSHAIVAKANIDDSSETNKEYLLQPNKRYCAGIPDCRPTTFPSLLRLPLNPILSFLHPPHSSQHNSFSLFFAKNQIYLQNPSHRPAPTSAFLHDVDDMHFMLVHISHLNKKKTILFLRLAYLELSTEKRMYSVRVRLNKNDGYQMHNIYPLAEQQNYFFLHCFMLIARWLGLLNHFMMSITQKKKITKCLNTYIYVSST